MSPFCKTTGYAALLALLLNQATVANAQAPEATVELGTVIETTSSAVMRLPGTVLSTRDAEISAELEGRLEWVAAVGERVDRGEPLAIIDDHLLQLQLRDDEAQIRRISADIDYNRRQQERLQRLAEKNNMAQSELDEVESRLQMLEQDLRMAEVNRDRTRYDLQRSRVTAPFAGIVVSREVTEGEYTSPGRSLLRLVDEQALEVSVNAPLRVARHNHVGAQLNLGTSEQNTLATIRSVIPVGDERSRMMELRLTLEKGQWLIGEAVTVELPDGPAEAALSVPRDALVLRDGQVYVYAVSAENTARKVIVTTAAGRGANIAVSGDLQAGDAVVIRGAERLQEGQPLKVIEHQLAVN